MWSRNWKFVFFQQNKLLVGGVKALTWQKEYNTKILLSGVVGKTDRLFGAVTHIGTRNNAFTPNAKRVFGLFDLLKFGLADHLCLLVRVMQVNTTTRSLSVVDRLSPG